VDQVVNSQALVAVQHCADAEAPEKKKKSRLPFPASRSSVSKSPNGVLIQTI
jgi:hypothetical protein